MLPTSIPFLLPMYINLAVTPTYAVAIAFLSILFFNSQRGLSGPVIVIDFGVIDRKIL